MTAPAATIDDDIARLRRAARPLADPPAAPGWNLAELADVIDPKLSRRSAAVQSPWVPRSTAQLGCDKPAILR